LPKIGWSTYLPFGPSIVHSTFFFKTACTTIFLRFLGHFFEYICYVP
jgi:hypothetical protein